MKSKLVMGAFALVLMSSGAAVADQSQFYAALSGDAAFPSTSDLKGGVTGSQKYSFSSGGDIALGWQPQILKLNDNGDFRVELQGGYHAFGLDRVTVGGITNSNPHGDMKAMTLMANGYYDFHTSTPFTPFLGLGAGMAHVTIPKNNGLTNTGDNDTRFAYQGMLGVAYTAPALPQADWTLGYRYLGVEAPSFASPTGDVKISPVHESAVELGLRFHF